MEELLAACNAGIDSACQSHETGEALEEGCVFCNLSAMFTSIQGFVSKEPQGQCLENNFARLFGICHYTRCDWLRYLSGQVKPSCEIVGAYHLAKKIRKFRFKVKWKGNFPENPFRNCGLPPELVLF